MLKYFFIGLLLCLAGCQTVQTQTKTAAVNPSSAIGAERVLLRIDKYVDTYDVSIQRVVHNGNDPADKAQWNIAASVRVSGYPNAWRATEGFVDVAEGAGSRTFLLDGEAVKTAQVQGAGLVAKVVPESMNSARVVGVFTHAEQGQTFTLPFDVDCTEGKLLVLYRKEAASLPGH